VTVVESNVIAPLNLKAKKVDIEATEGGIPKESPNRHLLESNRIFPSVRAANPSVAPRVLDVDIP
jgi:hypothetical protein